MAVHSLALQVVRKMIVMLLGDRNTLISAGYRITDGTWPAWFPDLNPRWKNIFLMPIFAWTMGQV